MGRLQKQRHKKVINVEFFAVWGENGSVKDKDHSSLWRFCGSLIQKMCFPNAATGWPSYITCIQHCQAWKATICGAHFVLNHRRLSMQFRKTLCKLLNSSPSGSWVFHKTTATQAWAKLDWVDNTRGQTASGLRSTAAGFTRCVPWNVFGLRKHGQRSSINIIDIIAILWGSFVSETLLKMNPE